MSWNLSLKLNNLSNYVYSLFPTSSALRINNINTVSPGDTLTITGGTIALNGTTSIGTGNITTANITTANTTTANTTTQYLTNLGSTVSNGATINLTVPTASTANLALGILDFSTYVSMKATSASSVLIALTVPSLPNGFLANGQSITVSGVGAPWNGVYTVIYGGGITTSSNTYTLNNPSGIATGTTTTTLGTISYLNSTSNTALGSISSNGLTINNLNGKLGIVGGTSGSGNIIFCNNTTSTTGNFDLLTDSNQHLRFAGGSNLLTIGGATNGAISIPGTAGTITMANTGSILCNNLKNSGSGENLNLTAFTSGVASALTFNATSSNNTSASGMYGYISSAGWHFLSGDTTAETLGGINKYGYFINNCGYFIRGDKFNSLTSTSYWNTNDMVIWNNASSVLAIANGIISFGLKGASNTTFNFYSTAPSNYFNIQCQGGGATAYLYVMSQPANTGVQLTTSAPNGWVSTSDRRLKKNVEDISDALSSLLKLRPISFDFISNPDGRKCVGFIAQEIQEIPLFDYLVMDTGRTGENEDTPYLGIAITDFIPYSVKAIQEQNKLITDQQKQIDNQQKQIDELKLLVNQLLNK